MNEWTTGCGPGFRPLRSEASSRIRSREHEFGRVTSQNNSHDYKDEIQETETPVSARGDDIASNARMHVYTKQVSNR